METNFFTNPASAAGAGTAGSTPAANGTSETQQMFTKLLVAQIQNQDPLSPSDPSQFVQQLTQLSQTEAMQSLASLTSNNAGILQSMQVLGLGAQVGSDVMASATAVQLDGAKVGGAVTLGSNSSKTTMVLTGTDGVAHELALGPLAAGSTPFSIDPTAMGLPAGSYKMQVVTSSGENPPVDIAGRLNSVRLGSNGSIVLNIANVGEVAPSAITAFNGKTNSTAVAAAGVANTSL
ncbi:flagellar hook capping FlgD N-terminal domain-containing protein [Pseudoduganella umbonata]|uniref:Basal-body rod modification protein FlgD n=1 Tax=Pseudoduganella umbonata TaxID=864828 RepID=A0A4V1EDC5_9BURK|nr:flagellar hook capping FlgD N-terminal domain-containing protein [Pseudoduganella umbonata]MBB3221446.1 flagellar basal-body rod modification protein FlgD [Pseudoduganella umbonata]QCP10601.1 flagellar basal body rod modification protein [Pseudoduganella umbonata]